MNFFLQDEVVKECKDVRQNATYMEDIGNINLMENSNGSDKCTDDITFFNAELKDLKRCRSMVREREYCVIKKRPVPNTKTVHMLTLLLDVDCLPNDIPRKGDVEGSLMCYYNSQITITSTSQSTTPTPTPTPITGHTGNSITPLASKLHMETYYIPFLASIAVNVLFVFAIVVTVILYRRRKYKGLPSVASFESDSMEESFV